MSDCHHQSHCCCQITTSSVHQTLDEMEFERGIWSAAQAGEMDRIYKLIDKGEDANRCDNSGYTALHYAARNGHLEICRFLLSRGASIDAVTKAGNATALHRASSAGQIGIVDLLLSKGADVTLQDGDGKNALHRAAERKHLEIFDLLLKMAYIDNDHVLTNVKDNKGNLPGDYLKPV